MHSEQCVGGPFCTDLGNVSCLLWKDFLARVVFNDTLNNVLNLGLLNFLQDFGNTFADATM